MAATKYTKSITTDFTGLTEDAPHTSTLIDTIRNSSIITALDYIASSGDSVDLWFKDALSAGDQTTLSNLVAAHTGVASTVDEEPKAEDGKKFFTPDLFPLGNFAVHAGVFDDVTNGVRGAGDRMKIARSTAGTTDVEGQFIDVVLIAGGALTRKNGYIDDYVDMKIYAPGTAGTSNPGAGAYDKYAVGGGLNMYIPNGTTEGDWDLNLTEKLNANVDFTKVVPVPASGGTGWFDYNTISNLCTFNSDQTGAYNLFDGAVDLAHHVRKAPLLGDGKMCSTVAAVKPSKILPHWKFKVSITHAGDGNSLEAAWKFFIGRKITI